MMESRMRDSVRHSDKFAILNEAGYPKRTVLGDLA
jgi:hypothetical protein